MVHVLGAVGDVDDIERIGELALAESEEELVRPMEQSFRMAMSSLLLRDERGFGRLSGFWRTFPPALHGSLLASIGDTRDPKGLAFLIEVVSWHGDEVSSAIAQVRKLGPSPDQRVNGELAFHLRGFLSADEPALAQQACLALGELADLQSLPLLIELLRHDSQGLRENVLWALQELTGYAFKDQERWVHWYRREIEWERQEKGRTFRDLASRDAVVVCTALRVVARHPLARDGMADALRPVLAHRDADVRAMACRTAQLLRCREAVPHLVDVLGDPTEEVASAAHEALGELTGRDLPPDPGAWWAVL